MKEVRYGWIPILTSNIYMGHKDPTSLFESLKKQGVVVEKHGSSITLKITKNFSDKLIDLLKEKIFGVKPHLCNVVMDLDKRECACGCGCYVTKSEITILHENDVLVKGFAEIRDNGLTRYTVKEDNLKDEEVGGFLGSFRRLFKIICSLIFKTDFKTDDEKLHAADYLHIVVRDIFHKHIHHHSDMPLKTVTAESCGNAYSEILKEYHNKFIEYKRGISSKIKGIPLHIDFVIEEISRAKGELSYARHFASIFNIDSDFSQFKESFGALQLRAQNISKGMRFWINVLLTWMVIFLNLVLGGKDYFGSLKPILANPFIMYAFIFVPLLIFLIPLFMMFRLGLLKCVLSTLLLSSVVFIFVTQVISFT